MYRRRIGRAGRARPGGRKVRIVIALVIAVISFVSYQMMRDTNPVTGEVQKVALSADQEIQLGREAAPGMVQQHRGLHPDDAAQAHVDRVGARLVAALEQLLRSQDRQSPYPFEFHLLRDEQTVNAFALPGGQVFITYALYDQLRTEGELAGVVGHEIGHVLERHGAQRLAKQRLTQGLTGAVATASGDARTAQMAQVVGSLINMKYGRDDELGADRWGVRLTLMADYDPRAMLGVMEVLDKAGGAGPPEFLSTHPKPANRVAYIRELLASEFPEGIPDGLEK